jgi:hypothetical protein
MDILRSVCQAQFSHDDGVGRIATGTAGGSGAYIHLYETVEMGEFRRLQDSLILMSFEATGQRISKRVEWHNRAKVCDQDVCRYLWIVWVTENVPWL